MTDAMLAYLREALDTAQREADGAEQESTHPAYALSPSLPIEFILAGQDITTPATEAAEKHIRGAGSPRAVRLRVAAERKLLDRYEAARAEYEADGRTYDHESEVGRARTSALEDAVLLIAEGWGWRQGD